MASIVAAGIGPRRDATQSFRGAALAPSPYPVAVVSSNSALPVPPLIYWTDKTHHTQAAGCKARRWRAWTAGSQPTKSVTYSIDWGIGPAQNSSVLCWMVL